MSNRGLAAGTRLIPQLRNYECTFMVWPEGGFAPAHPGHAVLMLRRNRFEGPWAYEEVDGDGTYEPPYDESDTRYISFWPGSRRDKSWSRGLLGRTSGNLLPHHLEDYHREMGDGARARLSQVGEPNVPTSPRPGQIVIGVKRDANGTREDVWGQQPDGCVPLSALCPGRQSELGLNMNEIVSWAQAFAASRSCTYAMVDASRNCAAVAIRAMVSGGGDAFAAVGGNPSKGTLYVTPTESRNYAIAVAAGMAHVNRWLARIAGFSVNAPPVMDGDGTAPRPSLQGAQLRGVESPGHNAARDRLGARALRGSGLARELHREAGRPRRRHQKHHDHIQASGSGRRDAAFRELGSRILAVVKTRATQAALPWPSPSYYGDHALAARKF